MFLEIKIVVGLHPGENRKCAGKSFPFNTGERSKVCKSVLFKRTEVSVPRMEDFKKRNFVVWSKRYGSK